MQVLFSEYEKTVRRFGAERTAVIGNAVELSKLSATSASDKKDYKIVYAARFERANNRNCWCRLLQNWRKSFPCGVWSCGVNQSAKRKTKQRL